LFRAGHFLHDAWKAAEPLVQSAREAALASRDADQQDDRKPRGLIGQDSTLRGKLTMMRGTDSRRSGQ